ncbi:MAG: hypothetical protein A3G52_04430 [Candidatus Taylorbacteria bacterium RIFCSPLOWO2_12_FULL_43_20]|uniref:Uncharacterized protein n=1 Tax=Candidatus Taylorbacteria bacterium RIFCSPLOWO2_12_FULL_43_20 TaxID=1802332 RepID=A0A1G2P108_9BACT|nr:MAG: hypothetical protein A3B98_02090 [Candidatus Taylorbacteria bacterium RIFCSPHIGHO2_02_FULL_43_55]OHA27893.1 MAG: hypothetical protein A3E92_02005 [Candidatus Taylorbacteria bacterium RIFCSPHIGHO2_12_FULL_42_34]OHA32169.1 MAG: hypothetical protein A3B09_03320 [Candidatus Taylorbacteria bacterium RIFCSPLOWO2_01_FULL_43_83]OHA37714.1 MAG: hypothetical protein A3H58_01085 [Candidatus Taylorbacteria bacterium RIFCSPLOWO2_02_FULL_43_22b]OHA41409.1 MAG: hypothetical protein A3G52_04430 [Candid
MKTKRYWLRGLIIGFIAGIIHAINLIGKTQCYENCEIINRIKIGVIFFPFYILSVIVSILLLIIIGTICGVIYGKIKNRNKDKIVLS